MKNMSDRTKLLLVILLFMIFVFSAFFYIYKPVTEQISKVKAEISDLTNKVQNGEQKAAFVEEFNNKYKSVYITKEKDMDEILPSKIGEEESVILTRFLFQGIGADFNSIGFAKEVKLNGVDANNENLGAFGIKLNLSTNYDELKKLMTKINRAKPKVILSNMNISQSAQPKDNTRNLDVIMSLAFLTYKSDSNRLNQVSNEFKYKLQGAIIKPNLFQIFTGAPTKISMQNPSILVNTNQSTQQNNSTVIVPQNDFYAIISPIKYDVPSLTAGLSDNGAKGVFDNKDGVANLNYIFEGKSGTYSFSCSTDKTRYPASGGTEKFTLKTPNKIVLKVTANGIDPLKDNVGAKINITNKTDIPVEVIMQDVRGNSKITLNKVQGNIVQINKN